MITMGELEDYQDEPEGRYEQKKKKAAEILLSALFG